MSNTKKSILVVLLVLFIDQLVKILVKVNMPLEAHYNILGKFFQIKFIENNGMAFGWEFGGNNGKLFLSVFRIIAIGGIIWYLHHLIKNNASGALVVCMSLILAGAVGNIIDSAFYGMIFTNSSHYEAASFSTINNYSSFLHGRVVDMLYFPIIESRFPNWFPIWGGQDFTFFSPIFNIADSSITIGVAIMVLFQKKLFKEDTETQPEVETTTTQEPTE
jgi:signal peptidase II